MTDSDLIDPDEEPEFDADARRRVVRSDGLGAGVAILVGWLEGREALLAVELLAVAALFCVATAGVLYAIEHDRFPGLFPEVAAAAALVGLVALGAGLALALPQAPLLVAAAVLVGFGVGLLAYRVVFGLVRPVPRGRLERTS